MSDEMKESETVWICETPGCPIHASTLISSNQPKERNCVLCNNPMRLLTGTSSD